MTEFKLPEPALLLPPGNYTCYEAIPGESTPLFTASQLRQAVQEAVEAEREKDMRAAFMFGWKAAATWANRDDLIADIGSPAYEVDCATAIRSGA
jgi:hypothetical protein